MEMAQRTLMTRMRAVPVPGFHPVKPEKFIMELLIFRINQG